MDNASFHHCHEIKEYFREEGHLLYFLTPYSPFLNPIEKLFSQWKNYVRSFNPSNEVQLRHLIKEFKNTLTDDHCRNYCQNSINNAYNCIYGGMIYDAIN